MQRILLDMDGPLVDFDAGCERLWPGYTAQREPGVWKGYYPRAGIHDQTSFWKDINKSGSEWWANLPQQPWMQELFRLVNKLTTDWYILSSPSSDDSSYIGKREWIRRNLNEFYLDKLILTPHKSLFAAKGALLIDDREETTAKFQAAGGEAIVFPHIGNSLHHERHDPMTYLRTLLH